jgi:hypothetical protein
VCMLLCYSQIQYSHMVAPKTVTRTVGVDLRKEPKDLSASDIEECVMGRVRCVSIVLVIRRVYYESMKRKLLKLTESHWPRAHLFAAE